MRLGTMYRAQLFDRLGVKAAGERVLDVGTYDSHWLASQPGRVRVGVDLDVAPGPNAQAIRGDALNLPFADATFDSVFSFDVIEHVADDVQFVAELVRVTKPGGSITISTPSSDLRIFPSLLTPWAHRRWGHFTRTGYDAGTLEELFRKAGSREVRVTPLRTWAFLTFYLPLSVLVRMSRRMNDVACRVAVAIDSRLMRTGRKGYLLLTAER